LGAGEKYAQVTRQYRQQIHHTEETDFGQAVSAIMIIGYGIIAVPTGIVTAELTQVYKANVSTQACPQCSAEGHDVDAKFCKFCGSTL